MLTPALSYEEPIHSIQFSGGVSEYIYGYETADKGDLGNHVGRKIRAGAVDLATRESWEFKEPDVRIRATVIGASQYTVQVSGNTIFLSDQSVLPLRNLQVITPRFRQTEPLTTEDVRSSIESALQRFDMTEGDRRGGAGASLGSGAFLSPHPDAGGRSGGGHEGTSPPGTAPGAGIRCGHRQAGG